LTRKKKEGEKASYACFTWKKSVHRVGRKKKKKKEAKKNPDVIPLLAKASFPRQKREEKNLTSSLTDEKKERGKKGKNTTVFFT